MGNTSRNLPPPEHTAKNTHPPKDFPRKHQHTKTGERGRGFGSNTQLGTSNYQHHWVIGSIPRTECGSGTYYDKKGFSLQQHMSSGTRFLCPSCWIQQNKIREMSCEELGIRRVTRRMPDLGESNHSNKGAPKRHRPQNGSSTTRHTTLLGIS